MNWVDLQSGPRYAKKTNRPWRKPRAHEEGDSIRLDDRGCSGGTAWQNHDLRRKTTVSEEAMSGHDRRVAWPQSDGVESHASRMREADSLESNSAHPGDVEESAQHENNRDRFAKLSPRARDRASENGWDRAGRDQHRASPGGSINRDGYAVGDEERVLREREPTSASSIRNAGARQRFGPTMAAATSLTREESSPTGNRSRFTLGELEPESRSCGDPSTPSATGSVDTVERFSAESDDGEAGAVVSVGSDTGVEDPRLGYQLQIDQGDATANHESFRHARLPMMMLVGSLLLGITIGGGVVAGWAVSDDTVVPAETAWRKPTSTIFDRTRPTSASRNHQMEAAAAALLTAGLVGRSLAQPSRGARSGGRSGIGETEAAHAGPREMPARQGSIAADAPPNVDAAPARWQPIAADAAPNVDADPVRRADSGIDTARGTAGEERPAFAALSSPSVAANKVAASDEIGSSLLEFEYRVQIGAFSDEETAKKSWSNVSQKLQPLFEFINPNFEETLKGGATYYRVQIGRFATYEVADLVCGEIKRKGVDCFVIRRRHES